MLKAPRCVHLHGRRPGDFGQILDDFAGWDALLLHGARYPGHLRQEHDVFTPLKLAGVSWPYKKVAVQEDDTIPQSILIPAERSLSPYFSVKRACTSPKQELNFSDTPYFVTDLPPKK